MQDGIQDYYAALGVPRDADQNRIKLAFRQLAREYHPDKVATLGKEFQDLASEKMGYINEAYGTLCDPQKREEYDAMLASDAPGWGRKPGVSRRPARAPEEEAAPPPPPQPQQSQYAAQEAEKEASHEMMMVDSVLVQMRDSLKDRVKLNWADAHPLGFAAAMSAKTFTHKYYVYFKSVYSLYPQEFNKFMNNVRKIDNNNKAGFGGKDSMFVLAFSRMQEGIKVENMWKSFNEEAPSAGKNRKYITLINTSTSKVFTPKVEIKDKRMQEIKKNLRLPR